MIVVLDYGVGNAGSVLNACRKIGARAMASSDPGEIAAAGKLILPGVGSFDAGMRGLQERGLVEVLNEQVLVRQIPILGICLGFQLMARRSEEGSLPGLGWLTGEVKKLRPNEGDRRRLPHLDWEVIEKRQEHAILQNLPSEARFYFAHSYYMQCDKATDVVATAEYGEVFPAVVAHAQIVGVQFHPEKSHRSGMALIRNFCVM